MNAVCLVRGHEEDQVTLIPQHPLRPGVFIDRSGMLAWREVIVICRRCRNTLRSDVRYIDRDTPEWAEMPEAVRDEADRRAHWLALGDYWGG